MYTVIDIWQSGTAMCVCGPIIKEAGIGTCASEISVDQLPL